MNVEVVVNNSVQSINEVVLPFGLLSSEIFYVTSTKIELQSFIGIFKKIVDANCADNYFPWSIIFIYYAGREKPVISIIIVRAYELERGVLIL